jgi:aldose 1-epimerase
MKNLTLAAVALPLVLATACQNSTEQSKLTSADDSLSTLSTDTAATTLMNYQLTDPADFDAEIGGKLVALYTLEGEHIKVNITNYGARITGLLVPDRTGKLTDVVLGLPNIEAYQKANEPFYGPVVGRVGNRINKGTFVLDGKTYKTEINNNGHTLHGGPSGFHNRVWEGKQLNNKTVQLTYLAKDGEGGFPGNLTTTVTYSIVDGNSLKIDYKATTDAPTPVNPTSHAFFNLNGEGSGTINNHTLMIEADRYSAVDAGLIPQGEPQPVEGTPFDFRKPTPIGQRVDEPNEQLKFGGGYDHNWVLTNKTGESATSAKRGTLAKVCEVVGDKSGIRMTVLTTEPGLQFYGGNFFKGNDRGKYGKATNFREGFALEAQHFPDSPNHPTYPSTILRPGQTYTQTTVYAFGK